AAYTPFITHLNFQAIGRVLILDLIMGTEFPNEYPWDKEKYLTRAFNIKPYIDRDKQNIIGLNMAKSRQINWKTFKKRWHQHPENRYLMVQAIRTRMVDYLYAMNITKADELHEHFLNLISNE